MKESERLSRRWFEEGWIEGRVEVFRELAGEQVKARLVTGTIYDVDQFLGFRSELLGAFPDLKVTVEAVLAEEDRAAVLWRIRGTHSGPGFGLAPSGRTIDVQGTTWQTIRDGRIVEGLDCCDFGSMIASLSAPCSPSTDVVSPRLFDALQLAMRIHGRDARKSSRVPVLAHLLSVCALVQHDGGNEDEAIAALLHDSLEDKPTCVSADDIARQFGSRVLDLVRIATDTPRGYIGGKKPPWKTRKEAYLAHICVTEPTDLRVTVADKIDNLRAILADHARLGDCLWERFNAPKELQVWYYRSAAEAYRQVGFSGPLLAELDRLVLALEVAAA
jgi:GTP pyrophosphokinase